MKTELVAKYEEVQAKIKSLREEARIAGEQILSEYFKDYFNKYNHLVKAVVWTQATPYFNDGEECIFSIHDPFLISVRDKTDEEDEDYYYEYEDQGDFDFSETVESLELDIKETIDYYADPKAYSMNRANAYLKDRYSNEYIVNYYKPMRTEAQLLAKIAEVKMYTTEFIQDSKDLLNCIATMDEDVMKEIFGDHARIIVTKEGTQIEEYEHD